MARSRSARDIMRMGSTTLMRQGSAQLRRGMGMYSWWRLPVDYPSSPGVFSRADFQILSGVSRPHGAIHMRLTILSLGLIALAAPAMAQRATPAPYAPGASWERRDPAQAGLDAAKLADAVQFAKERESRASRDLEEAHYQTFGREPFGGAVGPFKPRGDATGVIVKGGYIVASWGDPDRVDMTFSVTKSFVSTVVGLAVDRGLIRSIDDTVHPYMAPVLHASTPALGPEGGRGR